MPEPRLDDAGIDHYWKHGYTVVRRLVESNDIATWLQRLEDIVEERVPASEGMLVMKDIMIAKGAHRTEQPAEAIAKVQDFENDPVLASYCTNERILDCIERVVGHELFAHHTMLINKPPNVDGRHPLHQDLLYFPFRPPEKIVAAWTALEPCTRENGCLVVVPGSHEGELVEHQNVDWEWVNAGYFGAKGITAETPRIHLEMEPGDTVFFHPVLLHGSGRNRTQGFRRAISAHFASLDCTWDWTETRMDIRPYRIVRGRDAGGRWSGRRGEGEKIDPLDYIRVGPARARKQTENEK